MPLRHRAFFFAGLVACTLTGLRASAGVSCADLALQPYGGATIQSATLVPADGATPAYCKVAATVGLQTDLEVRLPDPAQWKNRFLHIGGSGFDGTVANLAPYSAQLRQGYALAGSNGGHRREDYPNANFGTNFTLTQDYACLLYTSPSPRD